MSDRKEEPEALRRLRSAAVMSDFQMERAVRHVPGRSGSRACLDAFPDLNDMIPWIRNAA